jgi:Fe-S cluster biosynthesis and repair protein YggX
MASSPPVPPSTSDTVQCLRCGRPDAPALSRRPLRGAVGEEIQRRVCADCWADWQKAEVMVINELRLNFMDPGAQDVLERHMREFLLLAPKADPAASP